MRSKPAFTMFVANGRPMVPSPMNPTFCVIRPPRNMIGHCIVRRADMLTVEENELLTRIGPGTPCGELFRRYWHPIAMVPELSEANPTVHVRILGEDLVLFRDKQG